jgi:hypothetical protein
MYVRFGSEAHSRRFARCPLYPQKRTSFGTVAMSALCQKQTFCTAAEAELFDHLVGAGTHRWRHGEAERFSGLEIDH